MHIITIIIFIISIVLSEYF